MNRRKAIFAMLCAITGNPIFTEAQQQGTQGEVPEVRGFILDLRSTTCFQFEYEGKTVRLTGEQIWKELNQ